MGMIIKVPKKPHIKGKFSETEHEYLAMTCLNSLRPDIPNFPYVYGMVTSSKPLRKANSEDIKMFFMNPIDNTEYLMMEEVVKPTILGSYIKTCSISSMNNVLFIIANALYQAGLSCEFVHNDLHLENILITNKPCKIRDVNGIWRTFSRTPMIIDFGLSRFVINGEVHVGIFGDEEEYSGYHSVSDLHKLILLCYNELLDIRVKDSSTVEKLRLLKSYYRQIFPEKDMDQIINTGYRKSNYYVLGDYSKIQRLRDAINVFPFTEIIVDDSLGDSLGNSLGNSLGTSSRKRASFERISSETNVLRDIRSLSVVLETIQDSLQSVVKRDALEDLMSKVDPNIVDDLNKMMSMLTLDTIRQYREIIRSSRTVDDLLVLSDIASIYDDYYSMVVVLLLYGVGRNHIRMLTSFMNMINGEALNASYATSGDDSSSFRIRVELPAY